jgi:hypothetical protein
VNKGGRPLHFQDNRSSAVRAIIINNYYMIIAVQALYRVQHAPDILGLVICWNYYISSGHANFLMCKMILLVAKIGNYTAARKNGDEALRILPSYFKD